MNTNKRHFFYVIVAALTLAGCGGGSSGLSNAVTDPLAPKPNGNYKQLAIESTDTNSLLHDEKSTITITDEEKKGQIRSKLTNTATGLTSAIKNKTKSPA